MSGFVAVHVGAGYHGPNRRLSYTEACNKACGVACQMLSGGCSAVEAVTVAVSALEDCPLTNAGIGSNLTLIGTVECDAGIMDGATLNFGSVGSLCNIKNPVKVAKKILEQQNQGLLSCGRIPPCTLVGKGAQDWALNHGFEFTHNNKLMTKMSRGSYLKYAHLIDADSSFAAKKNIPSDTVNPNSLGKHELLDTVGAICVDAIGNVSSAVSSGGLLLKNSGRIGQSSIYGSGCWAENSTNCEKPSVACSVSGVGEYLIKTVLAKEWCKIMYENHDSALALPEVFRKQFLDSPYLRNVNSKLAGILSLKYYSQANTCDLAWVHNTKTMVLGYMCTSMEKPVSVISTQPQGYQSESHIVGSEKRIKLDS